MQAKQTAVIYFVFWIFFPNNLIFAYDTYFWPSVPMTSDPILLLYTVYFHSPKALEHYCYSTNYKFFAVAWL